MPSERILIVGGGVAGSVLAFWLAKHDYEVVVVERSKVDQKLGQGIEIEEPALQVVEAMGILDKLNEKRTAERGFRLVDPQSRSYCNFEAGPLSPTGNLELMRGDLTEVLYKAADESSNVAYHFETTIRNLRQTGDKVIVDLEDRSNKASRTEEFDMVVGADGARSRTRDLIFGSPEDIKCYKPVGAYVAYFDIPREERDFPISKACHFPDSRFIWIRPTREESNATSVYFIQLKDNIPSLREANASGDRMMQKEAFAEIFDGCGWEVPRVLSHMMKTDNFYSDELVQVKLPSWSKNRVVLLGDSAWSPTPFTGQGNQLAIIGGWVLAQELTRNRSPLAFEKYEKRLRTYVEESQQIPMNGYGPSLLLPETMAGIWAVRATMQMISWTVNFLSWTRLASLLPRWEETHFDLEINKTGEKRI